MPEPPIFDYERFMEEAVPSDVRFKHLFSDDINIRTKCRDAKTEREVLKLYDDYVADEQADPRNRRYKQRHVGHGFHEDYEEMTDDGKVKGVEREKFYAGLKKEIEFDFQQVAQEEREFYITPSALGKWEYEWLDNRGRLTKLEDWRAHLHIIPMCPEAFEKYIPLLIKLDGGREYFETYAWYYARQVLKEVIDSCKAQIAKASRS